MTEKEFRDEVIKDVVENKYHTILENAVHSLVATVDSDDKYNEIKELVRLISIHTTTTMQPYKIHEKEMLG